MVLGMSKSSHLNGEEFGLPKVNNRIVKWKVPTPRNELVFFQLACIFVQPNPKLVFHYSCPAPLTTETMN